MFTVLFVFGALIVHFMSGMCAFILARSICVLSSPALDMLSDLGSGAAITLKIFTLIHPSLSFYQVIRILAFAASLMQPGVEPFSMWNDIFCGPLLQYYLAMMIVSFLLMCIW